MRATTPRAKYTATDRTDEILSAATDYRRRGWAPIPLPKGTKNPGRASWQDQRFSSQAELEGAFANCGGIGLLTGDPSGGLVDVDLDCSEAIAAASLFLPETKLVHGRRSRPESHRWYIATPVPTNIRFQDVDGDGHSGAMLLELRSTGSQTLVPPSVHPSREPYTWSTLGIPTDIDGEDLRRCCAYLASATLLGRHWPLTGSRHVTALAIAGLLERARVLVEDAILIVRIAASQARDEEVEARVHDVRDTYRRTHSRRTTGAPTLEKLIGVPVVSELCEWLGIHRPSAKTRFAMLPDWLLTSGVGGLPLKVYGMMAGRYGNRERWCCVTQARLAKDLSVDERSVRNAIRELQEAGAIKIGAGLTARSNGYALAFDAPFGSAATRAVSAAR